MKKTLLFLAFLCASTQIFSTSFTAANEDGKLINYELLPSTNNQVMVVPLDGNAKYSGKINIPMSFEHEGDTYFVVELRYAAFQGCTELSEVSIPVSIMELPLMLFDGCKSLTTVELPNMLEKIGNFAFSGCSALSGINLPTMLNHLGVGAFENSTSLRSITLPINVKRIQNKTFYNCTALTLINLSTLTKTIETSAFSGCSALQSIVIPDAADSIYSTAFSSCSNLKEVTLGMGMKSIESLAFFMCDDLKKVTVRAITPPIIEYNTFLSNGKIDVLVPSPSVNIYKNAEHWSDLRIYNMNTYTANDNVIEDVKFTIIGSSIVLDREQQVNVYSISGTCIFSGIASQIEIHEPGVYIVRTSTAQSKIMIP